MRDRPVLLLDVDGVLNCLPRRGQGLPFETTRHGAAAHDGRSYTLRICPETTARVAELASWLDIVWCTTWRNASSVIAPLVGLPSGLPSVWLPFDGRPPFATAGCWKTPFVVTWAAPHDVRRLAWIDDEITEADAAVLREVVEDVLMVPTRPVFGLSGREMRELMRWLGPA